MNDTRIYQEKHTTEILWWKVTYYKYFKYSEGSMLQVSVYSSKTIEGLEK